MKSKEKFQFDLDFQFEILKYFIKGDDGGLSLLKIKPSYLTLIEHSLICEGISKFYKKNKRVPSKSILKQVLKELLESKNYVDLVTKDDIPNIIKLVDKLYNEPLLDSDIIKDKLYKFIAYTEMKNLNESFDLNDFSQYEEYHKRVANILQDARPDKKEEPLFMVKGTVERQFKRQSDPEVLPSPFKQLNALTNGGGFSKGSVVVILDKAKARKTFTLINMARGYLRMKKNVLYIDTENGKAQILDRMVQSTLNKTKIEMQSGDYDSLEKKHMRKYKRLGVEFIVEKAVALNDDCNYIKQKIREFRNRGIKIDVLVIDYAGKLASISRARDDFERISDVYIDVQNMALEEGLDIVLTAHHVTREGAKHKETKYEESDISGSIAIIRNAQCVLGLNATQEEEENNVQRIEIVVNRDGVPNGRAVFNIDVERQRMIEFTKEQRQKYDEEYGSKLDKAFKKKKKSSNPDADSEKRNHTSGDI